MEEPRYEFHCFSMIKDLFVRIETVPLFYVGSLEHSGNTVHIRAVVHLLKIYSWAGYW